MNQDPAVDVSQGGTPAADATPAGDPTPATALKGGRDRTPVSNDTPDPETFPREYVEKLRQEAADARVKAKRADDYARALFSARVAATGRLADPNDMPFDEALVDDMPALEAAIDELLNRHPHYAARTPRGDVGQGVSETSSNVDLAGILRARA